MAVCGGTGVHSIACVAHVLSDSCDIALFVATVFTRTSRLLVKFLISRRQQLTDIRISGITTTDELPSSPIFCWEEVHPRLHFADALDRLTVTSC